MRNNLLPFSVKAQNLGALFSAILLFIPQGYPTPTPLANDSTALIQVDLQSEAGLKELATIVPTIYQRLDTPQGGIHLLLPADSPQQETLLLAGFEFKVLDPDIRGETYYHLYGTPETLLQAATYCEFLISEGRQAVVHATPDQVERLESLGIMTQVLFPRPLIVPIETDLEVEKNLSLPSAITPSPVVQGMIDQVDSSTLYTYVGKLSGEWPATIGGIPYTILTRFSYSGTPIIKATQFAYEHFQSLGLPVSYYPYTAIGHELRDVIAEQTGLTQPQRIFMLVAHLDSLSGSPASYAPGADDNASGSAAVMATADILSQHDFGCTLRYALFTGEEQGLLGSAAYATHVNQLHENIEGVLNLDMLAYNSPGTSPTFELHTRYRNANDLAIANLFVDSVSTYSIDLEPEIYQDGETSSDHASFWNYNYPATMAIEDWYDHTPYYHSTGDQLETLNLSYYTEFTKAALATFAHMGCLLNGQLGGTVRDAATGYPLSGATVEARSDSEQTFTTTTQPDGTYQFALPPDYYTVTFSAIDHRTETVEDVQVVQNQITTLDRSLQPCIAVRNVDFTFSPYRSLVDETITFTATVEGGEPPITYSWDFRDGSSASGRQVTHDYHVKGSYAVRLTSDNTCAVPVMVMHPVFVEVELVYLTLVSK